MATPKDLTVDERISRERRRLNRIYAKLTGDRKAEAAGLIERAAFMRIQCEELEKDLLLHGWTELFQQSPACDPYTRSRPEGQAYQSLNANYQKIIKQLDALLPKAEPVQPSDGFDEFLAAGDQL